MRRVGVVLCGGNVDFRELGRFSPATLAPTPTPTPAAGGAQGEELARRVAEVLPGVLGVGEEWVGEADMVPPKGGAHA